MNKTLDDLRKEIDIIDDELLKVLVKRFDVVRKIGKLKQEQHIPPLDEKRWQEVRHNITEKAKKLNLSEETISNIYEEIHNAALTLEKEYE